MNLMPPLILASRSPRRSQLLKQMGFRFEVITSPVDENIDISDPVEVVKILSRMKAEAVLHKRSEGLIVGADTVVALNGKILGKPKDPQEAGDMLRLLSNNTHEVFTGFTIIEVNGRSVSDYERTAVTFHAIDEWEIGNYIATGSPMDKAGAYGIQDRSGLFVEKIDGCFYNVVGFPLTRFYEQLKKWYLPEAIEEVMSDK